MFEKKTIALSQNAIFWKKLHYFCTLPTRRRQTQISLSKIVLKLVSYATIHLTRQNNTKIEVDGALAPSYMTD